jgi:hypothetical protein
LSRIVAFGALLSDFSTRCGRRQRRPHVIVDNFVRTEAAMYFGGTIKQVGTRNGANDKNVVPNQTRPK